MSVRTICTARASATTSMLPAPSPSPSSQRPFQRRSGRTAPAATTASCAVSSQRAASGAPVGSESRRGGSGRNVPTWSTTMLWQRSIRRPMTRRLQAVEPEKSDYEQNTAATATAFAHCWEQKVVTLPAYSRGCHVITHTVLEQLPEILEFEVGMANFFIQHTSASLTVNENASPDVPKDLNDSLDKIAPEGKWYRHSDEGPDDMPAHVKSSLMGPSLDIPIKAGQLAMGTWQGIYMNEHRNYGGARNVVVTMQGRKRADGRKYPTKQYRW